ncbi:uncharacterized protein LOC143035606 [Oratosquilla oratoria]|uniref:uncharacterized protein LOC143035606 n=1 Tax=Oratosquilla oratoria TaxID=337810 RepID=UPI003F7686F5
MIDEGLYHKTTLKNKHEPNRSVLQLVVPTEFIPEVLKLVHDSPITGHPEKDKCLSQARVKYFWPTMRKDIHDHVDFCHSCASNKGHTSGQAPISTYPAPCKLFETIAIDLLKLPRTPCGNQCLFVCHKECNTLPYDPSSNELAERQNRTILNVLRHLTSDIHSSWDEHVPMIRASMNCAINRSISESPHFVLFGSDKKLPYDFTSDLCPIYNFNDYVKVKIQNFNTLQEN